MKYVIGIDLGTSAVKVLLVNQNGAVCKEAAREYPLINLQSGYSEQRPEDWVTATIAALCDLVSGAGVDSHDIEGMSFSGQMHGLVLLDEAHHVLRDAILWNDTRTTRECVEIRELFGGRLLDITKNVALEGFTLPKLLWVKKHEPELFERAHLFILPKDYLRFRLTGELSMEYSDAAGTLLLDIASRAWSEEVCAAFGLSITLCPPLTESTACVGTLLPSVAEQTGLRAQTKVFAGGADNACGAVGAGILADGAAMCSIGTSGVVLAYEGTSNKDFGGLVHYFNHAKRDAFYIMGVTLAAGFSLSWYRNTFAPTDSYDKLLRGVGEVPAGSRGLLFTPYLVGERTPHADASIRGSFLGMDGRHCRDDFTRAVMEGITLSLRDSLELFRSQGIQLDSIVSIGGGARNSHWLQMQADIFNTSVKRPTSEQGPGLGAAMLAAYGCGWFDSLEECARQFVQVEETVEPNLQNAKIYDELYGIYREIYNATKGISEQLGKYRL